MLRPNLEHDWVFRAGMTELPGRLIYRTGSDHHKMEPKEEVTLLVWYSWWHLVDVDKEKILKWTQTLMFSQFAHTFHNYSAADELDILQV